VRTIVSAAGVSGQVVVSSARIQKVAIAFWPTLGAVRDPPLAKPSASRAVPWSELAFRELQSRTPTAPQYTPTTCQTRGIVFATSTTPLPELQVVFGRAIYNMSGAANRQGKMVSKSAQQLESLT
jgi:hypothetical protein